MTYKLLQSYRFMVEGLLPIALLKEYVYCPRYAYYLITLHTTKQFLITPSMKIGREILELEKVAKELEGKISDVKIHVQRLVKSRVLKLWGYADIIIEKPKTIIVAEIKPLTNLTKRKLYKKKRHILIQALAYTQAAEETLHKPAEETWIIAENKTIKIKPTPKLRIQLADKAKQLWKLYETMQPPKTKHTAKCNYCQYKNICLKT